MFTKKIMGAQREHAWFFIASGVALVAYAIVLAVGI